MHKVTLAVFMTFFGLMTYGEEQYRPSECLAKTCFKFSLHIPVGYALAEQDVVAKIVKIMGKRLVDYPIQVDTPGELHPTISVDQLNAYKMEFFSENNLDLCGRKNMVGSRIGGDEKAWNETCQKQHVDEPSFCEGIERCQVYLSTERIEPSAGAVVDPASLPKAFSRESGFRATWRGIPLPVRSSADKAKN